MVAKERARSKEVREGEVYFKKLELFTPDYAAEQGLVVSEPVLTSYDENPQLIYQVGQITAATNLSRRDGGISYEVGLERHVGELRRYVPMGAPINRSNDYSEMTATYKQNGWVAIVEPQGLALTSPRSEYYSWHRRNEAVKITELMAFCCGCRLGPLTEGLIYDRGNGYLVPLCNIENHADGFKPWGEESQPKLKFNIREDKEFILSAVEGEVVGDVVSPKDRLVLSETEPKDVWTLVEKAREMFTPESPRTIHPFPLKGSGVVISKDNSGFCIATYDESGKEIGSINSQHSTINEIVSWGLIADPGDKEVVKGRRFPAEIHHFLLKTDTSLVVQPVEFYYDFAIKEWKVKATYPVVLQREELIKLAIYTHPLNWEQN